jgi:hypothetical protein
MAWTEMIVAKSLMLKRLLLAKQKQKNTANQIPYLFMIDTGMLKK